MSIVCSIIGKSHKGTEGSYVLTLPDNEGELFEFYKQYYPALAMDQPTILQEIEDSRFKKQEQIIQKLTAEIEDLKNDHEYSRVQANDAETTELLQIKKILDSGDKEAVRKVLKKIESMIS